MALPLLLSFLGGGLAKAGVLGAAGSFLANPLIMSAIGSGLGTAIETGDIRKGLASGLGSFAGGKLLGGMMGGAAGAGGAGAAGTTATDAVSGPMGSALRPMIRPEGLGAAAVAPGLKDIARAGMEFGSSAQGIGSMFGSTVGGALMPSQPPSRGGAPDISQFRPMQRQMRTPGPDFVPGISGEFDYGVSTPYTTDYMAQYAPQGMAMGGMVGNPYMPQQMPMGMAPMGMPQQPPLGMAVGGQVQRKGYQEGGMISATQDAQGNYSLPPIGSKPSGRTDQTRGLLARDLGRAAAEEGRFDPFSTVDHYSEHGDEQEDAFLHMQEVFGRHGPDLIRRDGSIDREQLMSLIASFEHGIEKGRHVDENTEDLNAIRARVGMAGGGMVQHMVPGYGPVSMREGGIANLKGATVKPNEKEVISAAVAAVQGQHPRPEIALGAFLAQYGEKALRDLVDRVQSGEFQDTQERFANGENGEVRGPGDGTGVDDMVPAVVDGQSDVLLSDGEFVLRKDATDALNSEFGPEFTDRMNRAGPRAPQAVKQMVAA